MLRKIAVALVPLLLLMAACSSVPVQPAPVSAPTEPAPPKVQQPVKLRFVSLAWQEQALAANKAIVAAWNQQNPLIEIEYVQGTWSSIHDYMLTSFEGNDPPDIFHYESTPILDWTSRGYLTDLSGLIPDEMKKDISPGAWDTVRMVDGKISGIPFLWESLIILYNKQLFTEAGITPPTTDNPWTWEQMRAAAKTLTKDKDGDGKTDQFGAAFGLRSPTNRILNLSLNFDGGYFYQSGNKMNIRVGEAEKKLLRHIQEMMYVDKTASLDGLGLSGPNLLPGFYAGKYAMLPGIGVWARQSVVEQGPKDLQWGVLPPLKGASQNQGSSSQTLSIPTKAKHKEEAMEFLTFFLNTENMGKLAQGDWLFPTRTSSINLPAFHTEENGWKVSTESARHLILAPFQKVAGYDEWKSKVATPIFQEFFANRISLEEAARRLEEEGTAILARYNK